MLSFRELLGFGSTRSGVQHDHKSETVRTRLSIDMPDILYAIGDVHGMLDQLRSLERQIQVDASSLQGRKMIVMLGDYVDRGPKSAQVIDHLLRPPPEGFERICLLGNHEDAMIAFMEDRDPQSVWLDFGGRETLFSYGVQSDGGKIFGSKRKLLLAARSSVPEKHLRFLCTLPILLHAPGLVFSHAGIRAGIPLDGQQDQDLLWLLNDVPGSTGASEQDFIVIHGHRIVEQVDLAASSFSIDTGAYATGRLTALRLDGGRPVKLLTSSSQ